MTLFRQALLAFLGAFLLLLAVLGALLLAGYRQSTQSWREVQLRSIEAAARQVLRSGEGGEALLPGDIPVFVYDAGGELVASNRGAGRRRPASPDSGLTALREDGRLLGYYATGALQFHDSAANRAFVESMTRALAAGAAIALGISTAFAFLLARSIARPAGRVASALEAIARGRLEEPVAEEGAREIAGIAGSANALRLQLSRERDLRAQWTQDIAHDLRTPVAALKAQLEGMADGVLEAGPERLRRTRTEVERIEALVEGLEDLMHLEAPGLKVRPARMPAGPFVRALEERLHHEIAARGLHFSAAVDAGELWGDEGLLHRALSNVLANAVRYADPGGRVRVGVRGSGGGVRIEVANTGPPIPSDQIGRVFDRLYRGEYARSSPGSGLGLTIARRIVRLHGGEIAIASSVESGTVVTVDLPGPV